MCVCADAAVLFIVISFSMGKSAVEDLKRHEADYRINHAICYRLNPFGGSNIHELVEHAVFKVLFQYVNLRIVQ